MENPSSLVPANSAPVPSVEMAPQIPAFEDSADLRDYLDIILRRKWLILSVVFVSFITTLIVSYSMQPLYKAKARIEVSVQAPRVTKFEDTLSNQVQTREFIQTQFRLLQSESLSDRVIERLQLDTNPAFHPPAKKEGGRASSLGPGNFSEIYLRAILILKVRSSEATRNSLNCGFVNPLNPD